MNKRLEELRGKFRQSGSEQETVRSIEQILTPEELLAVQARPQAHKIFSSREAFEAEMKAQLAPFENPQNKRERHEAHYKSVKIMADLADGTSFRSAAGTAPKEP